MVHSIEQRQDRAALIDRRGEVIDRTLQVIGLAAQQNQIESRAQLSSPHRRRIAQLQIASGAFDAQAFAAQLRCAPLTYQEGHVTLGLQQPASKVATKGAGADPENSHSELLLTLS